MSKLTTIGMLVLVFISAQLRAQDFPYHLFNHTNPMVNNPAFAAFDSKIKVDVGTYNLWAGGFKPMNEHMVSFSVSPDFKKQNRRSGYETKVGIGAVVLKEKTGPFKQNLLQLIYAYHIPIDRSTVLSLGICGMVENIEIDVNSLNPMQNNDPRLINGNNSSFIIDGGFGAAIHGENYQVSFSALNLAPGNFNFENSGAQEISNYRKFFLSGNYNVELGNSFHFQPGITLRNSRMKKMEFDISTAFDFGVFTFGFGYRSENSVFVYTQVPFKDFNFIYTSENPVSSNHLIGNGHTFALSWQLK